MKKELVVTWGKVPNYIKFSILNDVDNLKLEKQACILKRVPKIHDNDTKGKKIHYKLSSSVLKEIEKTTIVCKNRYKMI